MRLIAFFFSFIAALAGEPENFEGKQAQPKTGIYHSQSGQDAFIYENFFPGKKEGVFVEIGAHDGVTFSNTLFFEELGWKGICIEPIPEVFEKLRKNRKATCIQGCIANAPGKALFTRVSGYGEMLSGIAANYDPEHRARIEQEIALHGGEKKDISVDCFTLNSLLEKSGLFHVDYLSIDTEGGELDILRSIDFTAIDIDLISVENNYDNPAFHEFLTSKGYVFIERLGVDDIYKKPSFSPYGGKERPSLYFIRQFLPEKPVIVEAGACDGQDTVRMAKLWKKGQIYAFEPSPEVFKKLQKRCKKRKNTKAIPLALGATCGKADFYESRPNNADPKTTRAQGSLLQASKEHWIWNYITFAKPIRVPVLTLDAWAVKEGVKKIDFLWLDMQGSEFQMLQASPKALQQAKVIQTEISKKPYYEGTVLFEEAKAWMQAQGFILLYATEDNHGDALFVRRVP